MRISKNEQYRIKQNYGYGRFNHYWYSAAFSFATPYAGVLSLIGIILLIMAIKGFSQYFQDPPMYDNALRGFVYYIIAAITLAVAFAMLGLAFSFTTFFLGGLGILGIVGFIVASSRSLSYSTSWQLNA